MKTSSIVILILITILLKQARSLAQWVQTDGANPLYVTCLAISGENLYAGTDGDGVFLSTNKGNNWTAIGSGILVSDKVRCLAIIGNNLYAGGLGGVFVTSNSGISWTAPISGPPHNSDVTALAVGDSCFFAGTDLNGVFLSTDSGTTWIMANDSLFNWVSSLVVIDTNLYAGTFDAGVFLSTNSGKSWTAMRAGMGNQYVTSLAVSGKNLYAGTGGAGSFLSTNCGVTWTAVNSGLTNGLIRCFAIRGNDIYAGTYGGGVFYSTSSGKSWSEVNSGLTDLIITALAVSDTFLYAGTNQGVWCRPLAEIIASVGMRPTALPIHFSLEQNYPNPFNPSTTIVFKIPIKSNVSLKVYDLLGREIVSLLDEDIPAGNYSKVLNATFLSTGIYFYRLQAGAYTATKKLLYLK